MPGSQGNTNLRRQYEKPLMVLMGVVGLVLLIACANLASLLTARAASRQKEIAIRLAIGVEPRPHDPATLTESLLLAAAGGVAGHAAGGRDGARGLLAFLPTTLTGYSIAATPDLRMMAFTLRALAAHRNRVRTGAGAAIHAPEYRATLKDQAGSVMGGGAPGAAAQGLVAAQVALSLLLLIGAGLFVRSLSQSAHA